MNVSHLAKAMQSIAPLELAASWDNVGLLLGSGEQPIRGPVLLSIDLTERVLAEAVAMKASVVIAYHPPIWEPLKRITAETPRGRILLGAAAAGIAVYSPHSALDAAPGGMTDWLSEGLSGGGDGTVAGDSRAIEPHIARAPTQQVKIVTFVPERSVDAVRSALATAGAGLIGEYQVCSFSTLGTGTFFGSDKATPAVGQTGRLEQVPELRLEMVCSKAALALALETLSRFHPYQEPAVDVYELLGRPQRHHGPGRRLVLDQPATVAQLAERLKKHLNIQVVNIALAWDQDRPLTHIGVCPGSGASLAAAARADGCDVYITGEMQHHDVIAALHSGLSLILAGHTNTERGYLPRLARRLSSVLAGVEFKVSAVDKSPRVPV
jgi:dinuclear metal center YbgI/SA1388 family protein